MESTIVAAVQLSSQADVGANLDRIAEHVAEAAARRASLVLLPENFAFLGGTEDDRRAIAEPVPDGPICARLADIAKRHGVWLIGGGMAERSEDPLRPFNTAVVFASDGSLAARYRKIHLFDVDLAERPYRESSASSSGTEAVTVSAAGVRVGLSICYDVRFPELYRALVDQGADLLVVPAAFTVTTGKDHWHVLLRARAIEAQSYVVAAAQWGRHPGGRVTFGKSCIIDPWGEVIAQASEGEGVITAAFDASYLARVRSSLPSLTHRRLGRAGLTRLDRG